MSVLLDKSRLILNTLQQENIRTPEENIKEINVRLNQLRPLVNSLAKQYPAPGWTGAVALTYLKVGACEELVNRFALEYFIRFQAGEVSVIFCANNENLNGDNHCFCLVGDVLTNEELLIGRGNQPAVIAPKEHFVNLKDFLSKQKEECFVVDPLLNFVDRAQSSCNTLHDYSRLHNITHVIGIRKFPIDFVKNAGIVQQNAQKVASCFQGILTGYPAKEQVQARSMWDSEKLAEILTKFKLNTSVGDSVSGREQAFRRAAMSGTTQDLSFLLTTDVKIDAQDENPAKRNTALHQALLNQKLENALFLLRHGAKADVMNADGKTAKDLIEQLKESSIKEELKSFH